jgi:membrane fusion protein (multidrug efflux system)
MNRNKIIIWTALLTITTIGGVMLWKTFKSAKGLPVTYQQMAPKVVECMVVEKSDISRRKTFSGVLKSSDSISLVSENHGRIEKINCKQGDFVKKGQLLFQMDSMKAVAELQEAKANLKVLKIDYDRKKNLHRKKAMALSELEKSEGAFLQACGRLKKAQADYTSTIITAPFDGQIGLFSLSIGTHVSPNQELARLISFRPLVVEFQIPESDRNDIKEGQTIDVLSELLDELPVSATITAINPYSDPTTHTVQVKGTLSQESSKLRDGAFAHVTVTLGEAHDCIVVPQEAIIREGDFDYVYKLSDGRASKVEVIIGYHDGSRVQIESGLEPGALLIIDPVEELADGMPVKPVSEATETFSKLPANQRQVG